ncbi:MAG: hypothetical protein WCF06_05400, partial [Nitrososphaeraceae archaeon]
EEAIRQVEEKETKISVKLTAPDYSILSLTKIIKPGGIRYLPTGEFSCFDYIGNGHVRGSSGYYWHYLPILTCIIFRECTLYPLINNLSLDKLTKSGLQE